MIGRGVLMPLFQKVVQMRSTRLLMSPVIIRLPYRPRAGLSRRAFSIYRIQVSPASGLKRHEPAP